MKTSFIHLCLLLFRVLSHRAFARAQAEGAGAPVLPAAAGRGALAHAARDGRAPLPQRGKFGEKNWACKIQITVWLGQPLTRFCLLHSFLEVGSGVNSLPGLNGSCSFARPPSEGTCKKTVNKTYSARVTEPRCPLIHILSGVVVSMRYFEYKSESIIFFRNWFSIMSKMFKNVPG